MARLLGIDDPGVSWSGARVLVRADLNAPLEGGRVTDDARIRASVPTLERLLAAGAGVAVCSHLGRPKGQRVDDLSLAPVAAQLGRLMGRRVELLPDCVGPEVKARVEALAPGELVMLENLRFHPEEEANDPAFAAQLADGFTNYVNDAFGAAHRAHASTEGLARALPAYAGLAMQAELEALEAALGKPRRPVLGIVGGSKVSTKLDLLKNLVTKLDRLAIGGGMANTFLFAQGHDIGGSFAEKDLDGTAREIIELAEANNCELLLPIDVVVAEEMKAGVPSHVRALDQVQAADRILDAGPQSAARLKAAMETSQTLIWNGPLGVFEIPPFDKATVEAARHAAKLAREGKLIAVAGGGDTVAALNHAGSAHDFTFVSTAGGAFLEWMEGKTLPDVAALEV